VGVNVMVIVQVELAERPLGDVTQVLDWVKSPLALMFVNVRLALPVLVTVIAGRLTDEPTSTLPKGSAVAERLIEGPNGVPVPVRPRVCGLSPLLSLIVSRPDRVPVAVGVKVTVMGHDEPAAKVAGQLDAAKSPLAAMLVMFRTSLPVLLSETVCGVLGVVTAWAGKVSPAHGAAGAPQVRLTAGPFDMPLPVSPRCAGCPERLT